MLISLSIFGVATNNLFKEDLLGSSPHTSAHPKLLKILPRGANLFQRNAASVSARRVRSGSLFNAIFFLYFGQG